MNYFELDKKEEKILKDFNNNQFIKIVNSKKEVKNLQKYATNTLNKTKNINIRLSEKDLHKIKVKAMEKGIPYQTFIASLIHQVV